MKIIITDARITGDPPEARLGLIGLPLYVDIFYPPEYEFAAINPFTGKKQKTKGYPIHIHHFLVELQKHNPEAYRLWVECPRKIDEPYQLVIIPKNCCQIIDD